jgi:hypothetical protein
VRSDPEVIMLATGILGIWFALCVCVLINFDDGIQRGDDRWFSDRPLIKDRPMILTSDRKEKSVARRKNKRAARRITRKNNG